MALKVVRGKYGLTTILFGEETLSLVHLALKDQKEMERKK